MSQSHIYKELLPLVLYYSVFLSILLTPLIYYVNDNYTIFIEMAYQFAPKTVLALESERRWINKLIMCVLLTSFFTLFSLGRRWLKSIYEPQEHVIKKLKAMSFGPWNAGTISNHEIESYNEIISHYNHLYLSHRDSLLMELEDLQKLDLSKDHPQYSAWINIIDKKYEALGIKPKKISDPFVSISVIPDSRHAS